MTKAVIAVIDDEGNRAFLTSTQTLTNDLKNALVLDIDNQMARDQIVRKVQRDHLPDNKPASVVALAVKIIITAKGPRVELNGRLEF